jgi:hypothetical protein
VFTRKTLPVKKEKFVLAGVATEVIFKNDVTY